MRSICMAIMIATVAAAASSVNRAAPGKAATNKLVRTEGKAVSKALLKMQPKNAIRVKDAENKTRDLPIMFDNNRLKKIKGTKGTKK